MDWISPLPTTGNWHIRVSTKIMAHEQVKGGIYICHTYIKMAKESLNSKYGKMLKLEAAPGTQGIPTYT